MTAPATFDTATPVFTTEQAQAIADFCEARAKKVSEARRQSVFKGECDWFAHQLTDVHFAALEVLDGVPGAHDELQRLMEELDYLPLWRAAGGKVVA